MLENFSLFLNILLSYEVFTTTLSYNLRPWIITKVFCKYKEWKLVVWCLTPFSTVFQLYRGGQCTYPCFPGVLVTSIPYNILSKPLAAFPHNHCRNNGQQWERNKSCCNDYRQSSERILAEPGIKPATSCSQIRNATDWVMGLGTHKEWKRPKILKIVLFSSISPVNSKLSPRALTSFLFLPCSSEEGLNTSPQCIVQIMISPNYGSIKIHFVKQPTGLWGTTILWVPKNLKIEKSIDPCQPALPAQADISRYFSQMH